MWPEELFSVFDDAMVTVELLTAKVTISQPSEVADHVRAFEELRSPAVYSAEARALIVKAIDTLR
ncbi:Scr1 family TA system antitoxin-like transcriptional regulator [Streptomyces sp. Ncost-T10-10d]|uniref:Scr1 family TA system antitoxin-like transcriptional regulator n=1 Tax=Streptomyces sp. Ncost-T10-10d TaxID=1839774 RepID=UPI00081D47D0|nr:Scr1 family TA system antitoxin-like transcriptional regulator [Streptomyces sp. Ncost-T10-10d]SCF84618.1 hypothetical protein GA0115254_11935 [Streptomyces sp. Ncost-T10-10d]